MPRRHAFTMIELLVVIAIIATLAGLLIPTTTLIKKKINDVKCSNNLRQVATATIAFRSDKDDAFPSSLTDLFTGAAGLSLKGLESKLLVCPRDQSKGATTTMNRGGPLTPTLTNLHELGCSYLYQCSGKTLNAEEKGWFFFETYGWQPPANPPRPAVPARTSSEWGNDLDATSITWAHGKRNQQQIGNAVGTDPDIRGDPFPSSFFPIISCFWHNQWNTSNIRTDRKVVSVSWDGNIFWHIPFWEHQINDNIPLP